MASRAVSTFLGVCAQARIEYVYVVGTWEFMFAAALVSLTFKGLDNHTLVSRKGGSINNICTRLLFSFLGVELKKKILFRPSHLDFDLVSFSFQQDGSQKAGM